MKLMFIIVDLNGGLNWFHLDLWQCVVWCDALHGAQSKF